MLSPVRRSVAALVALLIALLLGALVSTPSVVAAGDTGVAFGAIKFPQKDKPGIKVLWFDKDWKYLGKRSAQGGTYSLTLPAGTYHLQFIDKRKPYETDRYAPTDLKVVVTAGKRNRNDVLMRRGAFITGTVKAHGKTGKNAKVIATLPDERSFTTTADRDGRFAIGGLPEGKYFLFTYDRNKTWINKGTSAGKIEPGRPANVEINLNTRGGSLRVDLYTKADGTTKAVTGNPYVTAISKKTGQFWTMQVTHGSAVFEGLYPGRYTLVANGFGVWFGKTGVVAGANVKSGRPGFGTFTYTKRGGWVTGNLVDGGNPEYPLKKPYDSASGSRVDLYAATGALIASGFADDQGHFSVSGQIGTQSDVTLVVTPGVDSGGYMRGEGFCQFVEISVESISITIGQGSDAGTVGVPRHPPKPGEQQSPECSSE